MLTSFRAAACCAVAILTALATACRNEAAPESVAPEAGAPARYAALEERSAPLFAQAEANAETRKAADELIGAAVAEGLADPADPRRDLILKRGDSDFALYLFREWCDSVPETARDARFAFCDEIREQAPGTAVAVAALHETLSMLAQTDAVRFAALCDQVLSGKAAPREERVALFQRAQHLRAKGQPKQAALDFLRLWCDHNEAAVQGGLGAVAAGTLKEAGFALEADLVERGAGPDVMRPLAADLTAPHAAEYFKLAPDVAALWNAAPADAGSAANTLIMTSRMLSLCSPRCPGEVVLGLMRRYEALLGTVEQTEWPAGQTALLAWCSRAAVEHTFLLLGEAGREPNRFAKGDRFSLGTSLAVEQTVAAFSGVRLALARRYARLEPEAGGEPYTAAVRDHVGLLKPKQQRQFVCQTYETYLSDCPDSADAPGIMLDLAKYYEEELQLRTKAVATYRRVLDIHSDAAAAAEARLKLATLLYADGAYEEAYVVLQESMAAGAASDTAAGAKMMAALCEAAMGLKDECEVHMTEIARDHFQSPYAPRALFWLASARISRQDYAGAVDLLTDLTQRYPKSEYSADAESLLLRLAAVTERS